MKNNVCVNCFHSRRKTSSPQPEALEPSTSPEESDLESSSELIEINTTYKMSNLNTSLSIFEKSPLKNCRISENKHYSKLKFKKSKVAVKSKLKLQLVSQFHPVKKKIQRQKRFRN